MHKTYILYSATTSCLKTDLNPNLTPLFDQVRVPVWVFNSNPSMGTGPMTQTQFTFKIIYDPYLQFDWGPTTERTPPIFGLT